MSVRRVRLVALLAFLVVSTTGGAAAPQVSVSIIHPTAGAVVRGANVPVVVDIRGLKVDCGLAGKAHREGYGHWHVLLDDRLVDMVCGPGYVISLRNIQPGAHSVTAVPALNNHVEVPSAAANVAFTYRPDAPMPRLTNFNAGEPAVSISFPRGGAEVRGPTFPIVINVRNFRLSCDLYGKPQVGNTGHWHLDLNRMADHMATMLLMGCSNTAEVSLKGISPGTHTFIVTLVDNMHYPITPLKQARVTVRVK